MRPDTHRDVGPRPLATLYEADETAWLDAMARLAAERRHEEFDYDNLSEFLESMARRDRREVYNRLRVLLMHLLKWDHQPERRSTSWRRTIVEQRLQLRDLFKSGTLRSHGRDVLDEAFRDAVTLASVETGLDEEEFPKTCPYSFDDILNEGLGDDLGGD